ncbi:NAD(FAD)-utilizing dehydrogenases [hydrothermal vent metagenome]|uniref:NAD(FAD)-utilizing dehydrogenases n=1 Tax=hydrothermal vent metagenome TaxID=652676 RepID=A0A1W1E9C4_9ZZZZ
MIIIGGGAAGLCAAIIAGRRGINVTLLEQNSKVGKKILVSGNGKCNITNRYITPHRYYSQNPDFVKAVLKDYDFKSVETFFHSIGLLLVEGTEGKMFPMSMQASSVVETLFYEAKALGVNIICNCCVKQIEKNNTLFYVETTQGIFTDTKLLLASGSVAAPKLGGSNAGYAFATQMGHSLIARHPSLVQLCSDDPWVKACAGVKIKGYATLLANGETVTEKKGDLLFTTYGISGLAILDISRHTALHLAQFDYCELVLDLMPDFSKEKLTKIMLKNLHQNSNKPLSLWLQAILPKKLIPHIIQQSGCKATTEKMLTRKEIGKLVYILKHLKLSISDTKGFDYAEVATGGIDTSEVNPNTMESKYIPKLYFAGEILDVDGDRGGFNFHFAWVSAIKAASCL